MKHLPQISEAEWEVMTVLWEGSPLTAQSIIRKLEGKCSWKPKTVKSLISRLLNKKVIGLNLRGNRVPGQLLFMGKQLPIIYFMSAGSVLGLQFSGMRGIVS